MEEDHRYALNPPTQDSGHEDNEVIDTLSLSDFMIYDNNGDPQDFYRMNDQNLNDFDDHFEFSSELLKTAVNNNNVVFCGKIIPYKESNVFPNTRKLENKRSHKQRWTFIRFFKKSSNSKSNIYSDKHDLKYDLAIRRVSILASATKPRWYLFMFGFGSSSFSPQTHIRDLKKRQTSMGTKDRRRDHKKTGGDDSGVGSWSLVRFLGCGGGHGGRRGGGGNHHPNAIKKMG